MLATLGGLLALPLGLTLLLLPLLAPELSRPRDSAWGAVVLLLGLDLVTSADRLTGAPMLGVLCGALLISRLGLEVGQGRWRQLTEEERQRLGSLERWTTSFRQLTITGAGLLERAGLGLGRLTAGLGAQRGAGERPASAKVGLEGQGGGASTGSSGKRKGKRWVRPEGPQASPLVPPAADAVPLDVDLAHAGPDATAAAPAGGEAATQPGSQAMARSEAPGPGPAAPAQAASGGPQPAAEVPGRSEPGPTAAATLADTTSADTAPADPAAAISPATSPAALTIAEPGSAALAAEPEPLDREPPELEPADPEPAGPASPTREPEPGA